jgi:hypothetical protein
VEPSIYLAQCIAYRPQKDRLTTLLLGLLRFSHAGINEVLALPALNPDFLYAALDATAYAAFVKESRNKRAGATKLHRNPGKRRIRVEALSQSAKALLTPHKCGGSHPWFIIKFQTE